MAQKDARNSHCVSSSPSLRFLSASPLTPPHPPPPPPPPRSVPSEVAVINPECLGNHLCLDESSSVSALGGSNRPNGTPFAFSYRLGSCACAQLRRLLTPDPMLCRCIFHLYLLLHDVIESSGIYSTHHSRSHCHPTDQEATCRV